MPKLNLDAWRSGSGDINPVFGEATGPFLELILGDQVGLSQFGVRIERLAPGSKSSIRHWHASEDEFVYVLSGELVLVEDHETTLRAGDAAAWVAGEGTAHNLINRSDKEASFLIVGGRAADDIVTYPDHGVRLLRNGKARRFEKL